MEKEGGGVGWGGESPHFVFPHNILGNFKGVYKI